MQHGLLKGPTPGKQRANPTRCPRSVHAEKSGPILRRLARYRRPPEAQIVRHTEGCQGAPGENAEGVQEGPHGTPYPSAQAIARAYADAAPKGSSQAYAGKDLAEALEGVHGRIPAPLIANIVAEWKKKYRDWNLHNLTLSLRKILREIDHALHTRLLEAIPRPRKPQPRNVTITADDLDKLLQLATPPMRLFITLMVSIGLRFSEAARLGPQHVNFEAQTIRVETKGGKPRTFPISDELAEALAGFEDIKGSFIETLNGRPLSIVALRTRWNALKKKAGINQEVTPHDLRRTAAVRVYTLTKDVLAVKAFLGHDDLKSTAHYLTPYEPEAMKNLRSQLRSWTPKGEPVQ